MAGGIGSSQLHELGGFDDCYNLKSFDVPAGVSAIGEEAFSQTKSLDGITIPASVATIGKEAFWGSAIASLTIIPGSTPLSIQFRAFAKPGWFGGYASCACCLS